MKRDSKESNLEKVEAKIMVHLSQGILTYRRYTQPEFKLKFGSLLKAYVGKYTENSKINFSNKHCRMISAPGCNIS